MRRGLQIGVALPAATTHVVLKLLKADGIVYIFAALPQGLSSVLWLRCLVHSCYEQEVVDCASEPDQIAVVHKCLGPACIS